MSTVSVVVAARPNFMKVSPFIDAVDGRFEVELVHTGQHYDQQMSDSFFRDLAIRAPDVNLEVGSGTHGAQTAGVLEKYEAHLLDNRPDAVVVVGDVNSTLAAALAAAKLHVPVAHIEAGLRSRDWSMPEEVNRVLTDRLATWLFTPSADGDENLLAEGADPASIHLVGNVMIDTLLRLLPAARERTGAVRANLGLEGPYAVATLHRPANVDDLAALSQAIEALDRVARRLPVVFSVHPRTRQRMADHDVTPGRGVVLADPMPYLEFLALVDGADLVLTDSGGIQEETSILGVPCLTMRPNTERPITIDLGTNQLVGLDPDLIEQVATEALSKSWSPAEIPLWDGQAGKRIADVLAASL